MSALLWSGKHVLKSPEGAGDFSLTSLQGVDDFPTEGWRTLVERYVKAKAVFHVHLDAGDREDPAWFKASKFYCVSFQWPTSSRANDLETRSWRLWIREYVEWVNLNPDRDKGRMTMLVDVPEFLEYGKWLPVGSALPCVKRLQLFELIDQSGAVVPQHPKTLLDSFFPSTGVGDDRKGHGAPRITARDRIGCGRRGTDEHAKTPSEIIKSGTQGMNEVTHDYPPSVRDALAHRAQNYLAGVKVLLGKYAVRFLIADPILDKSVQFGQVLIRPREPRPECFDRRTHQLVWESYGQEAERRTHPGDSDGPHDPGAQP